MGAAAVLVVGGVSYLLGSSNAPTPEEADDARIEAQDEAFREASSAAREEAFNTGVEAGRAAGRKAGGSAGAAEGDSAGSDAAAAEVAEQEAAAAEAAIPERCQGIPMNTTAYQMCIHAPGFPDSIPP